jgi:hypothetical protein
MEEQGAIKLCILCLSMTENTYYSAEALAELFNAPILSITKSQSPISENFGFVLGTPVAGL